MKIRYIGVLLLLIAAGSFLAGYWVKYNSGGHKPREARRILYYVDPMNPAFKSDKPGTAPCGMPLEPVYADQSASVEGGADLRASMPPGTVRISVEKQQLIGVKLMTVEKAPWNHTLRVLGRVAPDETRVYRVTAATSGWVQDVFPVTTGGLVRKDELLATFSFYAPEFFAALQSYLTIKNSANLSGKEAPKTAATQNIRREKELLAADYESIRQGRQSVSSREIDRYRQSLFSYGLTEAQLKEIERTRMTPTAIDIRSPAAGFILLRNVSPGLRFDRGAELFRIADLSKVWILADVFENESSFYRPGMRVKMELPYQKKTLHARMSHVLPQFDPNTRTLKVRIEADNPGYAMRPDMFVNVEIPVSGPPAIIIPVDAVLDSGLKKTVFVDRGNGFFEPRQVETGRSLGDRVEIARGLMPGEKIVASGNFLIDSEVRMQLASTGITGKIGHDPVCGMNIDEDQSRAAGNSREYRGKTYFFCTPECRAEFDKNPERYLKSMPAVGTMPTTKPQGAPKHKHAEHDAATGHMSHDHTTMPKTGDMNAMPPSKGGATITKQRDVMQMPGSEGSLMTPGQQGPAPMPGGKNMDMFPPATGSPAQQMPGSGGGLMPPGSQGPAPTPGPAMQPAPGSQVPATIAEPGTEAPVRSASPRPRRRGIVPSDSTITPGSQDVPAVPQQKMNEMILPGTGASPAELPQRDNSKDGKAHD